MDQTFYLDTARLGLAFPRAVRIMYALRRFLSVEGLSPDFSEILRNGFSARTESARRRHPGLGGWGGVSELRTALAALAGLPPGRRVLLAGRSIQLMRLAARLLFRQCRRVLVTDLEWPAYLTVLERERARVGGEVITVPARAVALADRAGAGEVGSLVGEWCRLADCDGLFLSAVSYQGVRLPVASVCSAAGELRLVVVDGAQALAHAPADLAGGHCDFYIAGCHKWLRSGVPMGVAFCPNLQSEGVIRSCLRTMLAGGELDDPLLALTEWISGDEPEPFGETVDTTCLFAARAAVEEHSSRGAPEKGFPVLVGNALALLDASHLPGWRPVRCDPSMRSGIVLLRSRDQSAPACALRARLAEKGVMATCYEGGVVRLSVPFRPWSGRQLDRVRRALSLAA